MSGKPDEQRSKSKGGRPCKLTEWARSEISRLAPLGLTDKQLSAVLHVTEQTLCNWKRDYPEFFEELTRSKRNANKQVVASLFAAAMGYSHPEEKIFVQDGKVTRVQTVKQYPPCPKAMALWLKNRDPDNWRDKQEVEHSGSLNIQVVNYGEQGGDDNPAA